MGLGMKDVRPLEEYLIHKCLFILNLICNQNSKPMPSAHNVTLISRIQLLLLLEKNTRFCVDHDPGSVFNTCLKLGKSLLVLWNSILPPKKMESQTFSLCSHVILFMLLFQKFSPVIAVLVCMSLYQGLYLSHLCSPRIRSLHAVDVPWGFIKRMKNIPASQNYQIY